MQTNSRLSGTIEQNVTIPERLVLNANQTRMAVPVCKLHCKEDRHITLALATSPLNSVVICAAVRHVLPARMLA